MYGIIAQWKCYVLLILMVLIETIASAKDYTIDRAQSIFAVITHKGGFASQLAHNHFVFASEYEEKLSLEQDALGMRGNLELLVPVAGLRNDLPFMNAKWSPRILELKLLSEELPIISESDRDSIHKTMLSAEQLDQEKFPIIHVVVGEIQQSSAVVGEEVFSLQVKVSVSVHGKTVERLCPANLIIVDEQLKAEAVGSFSFTEFGITPYSALMGAVKNLDSFHVYVKLIANARS